MKYLSVFTGIGGFDIPAQELGWECVGMIEIDKACQNVERRHFPGKEIFSDVREYQGKVGSTDLVCGGFPCQDLSIAGRREGLAGERSGLWYEFLRVITETRPRWVVIENVPGLLSSWSGERPPSTLQEGEEWEAEEISDYSIVVSGLVECGYRIAWRILDAQYFGVAQRRRRVFIVGSLGNGRSAQVLFERQSLPGNPPARREARARVAATIRSGSARDSHAPGRRGDDDQNIVTHALTRGPSSGYRYDPNGEDYVATTLQSHHERNNPEQTYVADEQVAGTLPADYGKQGGNGMGEMENGVLAYNIQNNDGGEHKRKDRPNGGMYVQETETALTVGSTDLTAIAFSNVSDGSSARNADGLADPLTGRHGDPGMVMVSGVDAEKHGGSEEIEDTEGMEEIPYNVLAAGGNATLRHAYPTHTARTLDGWTGVEDKNAASTLVLQQNSRDEVRLVNGDGQIAGALAAEPGMKQQNYVAQIPEEEGQIAGRLAQTSSNGKESSDTTVIAYNAYQRTVSNAHSPLTSEEKGRNETGVIGSFGVRRLTPTECERLQGYLDGWTAGQPDSVRYRQLGNAVAVPVARWVMRRIDAVEQMYLPEE